MDEKVDLGIAKGQDKTLQNKRACLKTLMQMQAKGYAKNVALEGLCLRHGSDDDQSHHLCLSLRYTKKSNL